MYVNYFTYSDGTGRCYHSNHYPVLNRYHSTECVWMVPNTNTEED